MFQKGHPGSQPTLVKKVDLWFSNSCLSVSIQIIPVLLPFALLAMLIPTWNAVAKPCFPHLGTWKTFYFLFCSFVFLFCYCFKDNSPKICSLPWCADFTISILWVLPLSFTSYAVLLQAYKIASVLEHNVLLGTLGFICLFVHSTFTHEAATIC